MITKTILLYVLDSLDIEEHVMYGLFMSIPLVLELELFMSIPLVLELECCKHCCRKSDLRTDNTMYRIYINQAP